MEFLETIGYRSKRQVIDNNVETNPYAKLHPSLRPHPVFIDHVEALEKYYELRTGRRIPVTDIMLKKAGLPVEKEKNKKK